MKRLLIIFLLLGLFCITSVAGEGVSKPGEDRGKIQILNNTKIAWEDVTPPIPKHPSTKKFTTSLGKKFLQVRPGATVYVSEDTETIMQIGNGMGPYVELYYGYQRSPENPWRFYSRIENNRIVKADFANHSVWIEPISKQRTQSIQTAGEIPYWEDL